VVLSERISGNGLPGIFTKLVSGGIPHRQKDMKAEQHPRESQPSKGIKQKNDIHHQIAHLIRQLEASQCNDCLNESQEAEQTGS